MFVCDCCPRPHRVPQPQPSALRPRREDTSVPCQPLGDFCLCPALALSGR